MRRALPTLLVALFACAGDPAPPAPLHPTGALAPLPDAVVAMGSGAATPLLQALARAYSARRPALPVRVERSVGTTGGVAAALDGAVDLGLVGRALRPGEAPELEQLPVALDAVVVAASPDVERQGLTRAELRALYSGDEVGGLTLLLRESGESGTECLESAFAELPALRRAAAASGKFRILDHDDAMVHALLTLPRTAGVFSLGEIHGWRLPLRPLALDGLVPSVSTAEARTWPAVRTLRVVFRPERRARLQPFFAFLASPEARAVTREAGYAPLPEARP